MSRGQTPGHGREASGRGPSSTAVKDALLLVDVIQDFRHESGDRLLESFRRRQPALVAAIQSARRAETPIVYANDNHGVWDGDAGSLVRRAVEDGRAPRATILALACATTDERVERLALEYAERIVGRSVERSSEDG